MDYRYHIACSDYERDKESVEALHTTLKKYCPRTLAMFESFHEPMRTVIEFYEALQDEVEDMGEITQCRVTGGALEAIKGVYDRMLPEANIDDYILREIGSNTNVDVYYSLSDFANKYIADHPEAFNPSMVEFLDLSAVAKHAVEEYNRNCAPDMPRAVLYSGSVVVRTDGYSL